MPSYYKLRTLGIHLPMGFSIRQGLLELSHKATRCNYTTQTATQNVSIDKEVIKGRKMFRIIF
jgi:hypothetical protein